MNKLEHGGCAGFEPEEGGENGEHEEDMNDAVEELWPEDLYRLDVQPSKEHEPV